MLPASDEPTPSTSTIKRKTKGLTNNTCARSSKEKRLTRQLAGIMAHLEKNPGDVLSQQRVAKIRSELGA